MHGSTGWSFRVPPGWPVPPAGWAPTPNWRPDRSWPPAPAGWVFWVPSAQAAQAVFAMPHQRDRAWAPDALTYLPAPLPAPQHRSRGVRIGLLVAACFAVLMPFGFVGTVTDIGVLAAVQPEDYMSGRQYQAAYDDVRLVADLVLFGAAMVQFAAMIACLAPRAGYRRRDAWFALVPVWGTVVFCRLLWRWTDIDHWRDRAPAPTHAWAHAPARP